MKTNKINPSVYFDENELSVIRAAAKLVGLSISGFIRTSSLIDAKRKLMDLREVSLEDGR